MLTHVLRIRKILIR